MAAQKTSRGSGRSETIVEGDQRSLLRTFAAPHQGCGKVCGVSGAKNVCSERSLSGLLRKGD
jgi:hypothetical protein